jgi:hypothetical protein
MIAGYEVKHSMPEGSTPSDYVPAMEWYADGSVSWNQPDSTLLGYNGFCGYVAWSNAVTMYSNRQFDPSYFRKYSSGDLTPGLRPSTLLTALNTATRKNYGVQWILRRFDNKFAWSNLNAALARRLYGSANTPLPLTGLKNAPVLVLVQSSAKTLHWLTVVRTELRDQDGLTYVVVNDLGMQRKIPQQVFMRQWALSANNSVVSQAMRNSPGVGQYVAIVPHVY